MRQALPQASCCLCLAKKSTKAHRKVGFYAPFKAPCGRKIAAATAAGFLLSVFG